MICPACDEIFPPESFGEPKCCPACGAYYEKALKLRAAKKTAVFASEKKADKQAKPASSAQYQNQLAYKGMMFCTSCGAVGGSKRHVPGSILIEIVLWLCFLIPGLIYTIWRYSASKRACKVCSMPTLIPAVSPLAQKMLKQ